MRSHHHRDGLVRAAGSAGCGVLAILLLTLGLAPPVSARTAPSVSRATPGPDLAPLPAATPRAGRPLAVVTSTPLLADLVQQLGGSRVAVRAILPADADPHEYEPTPRDLVQVEQAQLITEFGLNLDRWAADLVDQAATTAPVVVATVGVPTLKSAEARFPQGDPHAWFDPTNVQIMAANIATGLTRVDPDGAATYMARRVAYDHQLTALDAWIKTQIATIPPDRRKLVTNHDAFGYYVRRYGLTFVGSVIPSLDTNTEPSAQQTATLIARIKAEHVPAIFTEASVNPKLEQQLGQEAGVRVVDNLYGDNLGKPGSPGATYTGMMVFDTSLIVDALR